jgi:predicted MFS family arabinose efflux permease
VASVAAGVGTTIFAIGLASFGLSSGSAVLILVSTVFFVTGIMISGPTMFAHPAKAPDAVKGRYIGASQAVFGFGLALGPVLGVASWNQFGSGIWPLCGLLAIIAAGCAAIGMQERPEQDRPEQERSEPVPAAS